ncbi:hypothetical protein KW791_03035 [Candidatus Parcubacteria bacterium]|nr:hypothetical protein [Candidatus Parcubacteria bacterium]
MPRILKIDKPRAYSLKGTGLILLYTVVADALYQSSTVVIANLSTSLEERFMWILICVLSVIFFIQFIAAWIWPGTRRWLQRFWNYQFIVD